MSDVALCKICGGTGELMESVGISPHFPSYIIVKCKCVIDEENKIAYINNVHDILEAALDATKRHIK